MHSKKYVGKYFHGFVFVLENALKTHFLPKTDESKIKKEETDARNLKLLPC